MKVLFDRYIKKHINRETISYLIVGIITTIIAWVAFIIPINLNVGTVAANTISHGTAIIFAFFMSKIFVFESKIWKAAVVIREFVIFVGSRVLAFVGETLLLVLLVDVLGYNEIIMKLFTMCLVVVANYFVSKFIVFRRKKETQND